MMAERRWMPVDEWLAARGEFEPPRRRADFHTPTGPAPRPPRRSPVRFRWPQPPPGDGSWSELLAAIDQVVAEVRKEPRQRRGGRAAALKRDEELARQVYDLIRERGLTDALRHLNISYQSVVNVWLAHGWPAPLGSGNYQKTRRTA